MEVNEIFYTFSTIAQTLGGVIALLAAFVLFKMQLLRSQIEDDSNTLTDIYQRSPYSIPIANQIRMHHEQGMYNLVLESLDTYPLNVPVNNVIIIPQDTITAAIIGTRLTQNLTLKKGLINNLKWSMLLTAGLILTSIIILSIATTIKPYSILVLVVCIIWFIICLYSYYRIVIKSI